MPVLDRPSLGVYDGTQTLDPQVKKSLETLLTEHQRITNQEIVLSIFPRIEKSVIASLSRSLYQSWKMGTPNQSNGALLVLSLSNALAYLEVGYGLESLLSPQQVQQILKESIRPFLKQNQLNEAATLGTFQILETLESPLLKSGKAAEILKNSPLPQALEPATEENSWMVAVFLLILGSCLFGWVLLEALSREAHFSREGWYRIPPSFGFKLTLERLRKRKNSFHHASETPGGICGQW